MQNANHPAQSLPANDSPQEHIHYKCKCTNLPVNVIQCLELFIEEDLLQFASEISSKGRVKQGTMRHFMEGYLTAVVKIKDGSTRASYRLFDKPLCFNLFKIVFPIPLWLCQYETISFILHHLFH